MVKHVMVTQQLFIKQRVQLPFLNVSLHDYRCVRSHAHRHTVQLDINAIVSNATRAVYHAIHSKQST